MSWATSSSDESAHRLRGQALAPQAAVGGVDGSCGMVSSSPGTASSQVLRQVEAAGAALSPQPAVEFDGWLGLVSSAPASSEAQEVRCQVVCDGAALAPQAGFELDGSVGLVSSAPASSDDQDVRGQVGGMSQPWRPKQPSNDLLHTRVISLPREAHQTAH